MISIDIDSFSPTAVYKTIWKGLRLGPSLDIVEVSPSGSGFHVIFKDEDYFTDLFLRKRLGDDDYRIAKMKMQSDSDFRRIISKIMEGFPDVIFRALLDDDAYRIRHSLKRLFMNSQVDICFWAKGEGISKVVYPSDENFINLKEIEKAETIEEVVKLAEASKLNKIKVKSYATFIPFNGSELKDKIDKVIHDIMDRDETFRARIYPSYLPDFDFALVIFSSDNDTAEKRGMWFINKVFPKGHYYKVKEMVQK